MEPTDQEKNAELPPITGKLEATQEPNRLNATGIVYWVHEVDAAIVELGGDPQDKAWDKWDVGHIFAAAQLARELKAQYGEIAFRITPAPTQTILPPAIQSTAQVFAPTVTQSVTVAPDTDAIAIVQPPVTVTAKKRYVYGSGRATAKSSARADASVVRGGDRHTVVTDSGKGIDHLTATDITTGAPVIGRPGINRGGRPSVLTPEAEQSALQLMKKRIPQEAIAGRLGVSVSTIKRLARRYRNRQP